VRNELRGSSSRRDEERCLRVELRRQAKQIAVKRSAKTLIGGDENDGTLPDLALFEQRMGEIAQARGGFPLDAVKQMHEWTSGERPLLDFRIFDAATICMARVICAVLPMERILRCNSRRLCIVSNSRF
jgi:hypothetical protein